jgi:hypothetical protein
VIVTLSVVPAVAEMLTRTIPLEKIEGGRPVRLNVKILANETLDVYVNVASVSVPEA